MLIEEAADATVPLLGEDWQDQLGNCICILFLFVSGRRVAGSVYVLERMNGKRTKEPF